MPYSRATNLARASTPLKSRLLPLPFQQRCRRSVAGSSADHLPRTEPASGEPNPASLRDSQSVRRRPLSPRQKRYLDSALRVNHAGELAATLIYTAQTPPTTKAHPELRPLMKHMYDQEAGHFQTFNHLLAHHRIRPTALYPLWSLLATGLGWSTAVLGREAAMACTEAVETEIGDHYNNQVREMLSWITEMEQRGEPVGEELQSLVRDIRRIRDEELEHLDSAVGEGAKDARPYELLTGVIRAGCRGAIWVSEKI